MGGCVCPNFGLIKLVACNAHYNDNNDDDVSLKLINYIYGATASKGSASHGTFINIVKILKNAHVLSCTSDVGTFVSVKVNLKNTKQKSMTATISYNYKLIHAHAMPHFLCTNQIIIVFWFKRF